MCMVYNPSMLRINIYVPEELNKKLNFTARSERKVKAQLIREALEEGLNRIGSKSSPNKALFKFIKLAESIPSGRGEPTDVSVNHDYYAWGAKKRVSK